MAIETRESLKTRIADLESRISSKEDLMTALRNKRDLLRGDIIRLYDEKTKLDADLEEAKKALTDLPETATVRPGIILRFKDGGPKELVCIKVDPTRAIFVAFDAQYRRYRTWESYDHRLHTIGSIVDRHTWNAGEFEIVS